MSIIYGLLAALITVCLTEALRPVHRREDNENIAGAAECIAGLAVGVTVFLALQVGA